MRVSRICKCGEEIFFDLGPVGLLNPSEVAPIDDMVRERVGEVSPEDLEWAVGQYLKGKEYKRIRLFQKCSKCGVENVFIIYAPLN
jgi:hypothetical protein